MPFTVATSTRSAARAPAAPSLAAYVLHHYDWSDTSLIVELFTREQGRIAVVAKGAKRASSNLRAVLLPFHRLAVSVSRSPSASGASNSSEGTANPAGLDAQAPAELRNLRSAEWPLAWPQMPLPAAALLSAFYLNELVLKGLAQQDPHPALFDVYAQALSALAVGAEEGPVLRAFELLWLTELGWMPSLHGLAATGQPLNDGDRYALQAEQGLAKHPEGLPGQVWRALAQALEQGRASFATLCQACALVQAPSSNTVHGSLAESAGHSRSDLRADSRVLRSNLQSLVHYHLNTRLLRTRQLGRDVRQLQVHL